MANELCEAGAELGWEETDVASALCDRTRQGLLPELRLLVKCGASVNAADYDKRTCLHLAASEGLHTLAAFLLEAGAHINAKDRWGGTPLRDAVREGRLDDAGQMLGRNFAIKGTVIKGDGKGRQIGFATANIDTSGRVLPPNGVYAVHAQLGQASHRAVLNIGVRPTLAKPEPSLQVEAHLLDYDGELYGKQLRVEFVDRLREEKRFDSVKELTAQISRDIERAQTLF